VRRAGLIGVALALLLGATACSRGPLAISPAATVDGTEISKADVTDLTAAYARFYKQAESLGQDSDGQLAALYADAGGTGTDTQSMIEATGALEALINSEMIRSELTRQDALPTKEDRDAIRTELATQLGGEEKLAEFDEEFMVFTLDSRALTQAFQKHLAAEADEALAAPTPEEREAQMRELFASQAPNLPLCLNAIETQTEAEATAARERVESGEAFGDVAADLAPEGVTVAEGGFAACLSFEDAQAAFSTDLSGAAVGDLVGPVAYTSQEGAAPTYLVLEVDGLEGPTYEQLLPRLEQAIPAEPTKTDPTTVDISAPLAALYAKADISVDPLYGSWSNAQGRVVPPDVPVEPTTAKDAADADATTTTTAVPVTTGS
jgi:hypothetical protein